MGQSVKNKDPNKIGRFGIGFNSIYHITDLPWIFSGTNIGVLDPQQSYLEDGGWWSVEDEEDRQQLQNYPEQFEPLRWALQETSRQTSWEDLLHGEPFRGTLFRFPLRAEASKISDNLYNHQRVFELFKSFQADSELSLLFLKNVASISMRHIDPDGNVTNHLTVTASQDTVSEESMAGEAFSLISASETSYCLKLVSRQSPGLAEHCCKWLVSSFTARSGQDSELDELAEKMKYLPCVGLAYPLTEDNCKRPKGRLSCFLPLPDNEANWTGLPVHVNACFGLTDNRRYVKWLEEDQKYDEAAQWNELLLNQLLPPAYCQTILCAIALTQSQSSPMQPSMTYNLWPDLDNLAHKELWRKMGETMCKLLVEYKVLCSARSDTDWLKPREAIFPVTCKTEDQILGAVDDLLLAQQQPLVKVPKHVYNTVKSFFKEKLTQGTPEFLCNILRSCDLNSIAADQKLLLLEFILKDYQCVKGLQLLPLSDGTFTKFCSPGQGQTVFIDSKEFPRSLLPGLEKNFIPLNLRPALWGILNHLATKNIFNFCHLNANLVTENLKGAIPSDWASGCDKVTWKTRSPAHPPIKWLSLVWNFLAKHCTDLKPFEDLPLIPLMPLTEKADTVQLVRLTKSTNLFFQTENGHTLKNDVVSILEKLGGQVIKQGNSFLSHPHLNSYILYPSVGNVLRLLSNIGMSVVKTKLISTSTEDKNKLRQLLSTASQLTEKEKQFVSELPIFRQMPSLTSLGKECIAAQKLEAVKNETIPNIPSDVVLPETVLNLLYNQNSAIQEKCKTLKFMDKGGTLVEPAALFDPEEETLKELFSKDFFPQKAFAEQRILKTLRVLGLRSCLGSITPDEFLAVASKLQNENSAQAYRKSDALVRVCNETDIFSKCTQSQLRALCSVPWVSAEKTSKTKDKLSQQYQQLLKKCGIKSSLSPAEIVDFLSDLKKNIDSQAITAGPKELKFAISILEWMRTTQQDLKSLGYEESLLLPIQKNAKNEGFSLQPLSNVLFPDISSEALDDLCEDEEDFYLLHSEIPRAMSEHFCVPFLSTRILKPEFIGIEQYGQTEPIPLRIKNILKEYDEESDLFKELIQNAEDAKATECSFLVDMRQNKESPENLIDPGMSSCHGPALWSFNDEVFTEDDFKNISRVGSASKETEVEKIGNFGLGFNAVYHITDIPSILSGKTLIIFDPNVTHLRKHIQSRSNPGIKLDISKHGRLLMRFPKQFQPYQDIFGCSIRDFPFEYKGTLIKLPFRTAAEAENTEATVGQAFCFLPLSIQSGLPVHINGSFSVTSNRKNLWSSGLKGEWNKAMLEDAVTSAYVTALLQLQNMCLENKLVDYDCYMFWPNMDVVLEPFTVTAEAFYQAVAKGFCGELLQLLSNGDKWCSIENAYFLDPEISSHERIGKTAFTEFTLRLQPPRMALCLPQWVREGFSKSGCSDIIDKHTYGWKQFYTEIVFGNLDLMDATTRNTFVLFAINMRNPAIDSLLKTTACIPTGKSGKLELIRNLIHPRGKVASLFEDDDGRIPNGSEADFLHPETLSRFETLGMVKDQISISDLIERAQTVKCLWKQNKDKACRRIQSILSFLGDVKINNTEQETIQSIAFLPALSPASPENIVEENVCLMSPRTMYKTKHRWLVSMIDPVLAKHQLDLDFKMSSETCNVLGLNRKPPIDTVLLQLEKTTILQYKIDPAKTEQIVKSCYGYLNECLKKDHTSREILARKLTFPFIFVEGKFVTSNEVAHNILLNADPYLYKLPVEYKAFQLLWMTVGIQDHFCFSDYLSILQKMSQKYQKSALDKSDLDLCLRVINVGFQTLIEEEPIDPYTVHSILLPDQNNVLQAIDKLHFNDTAWLKLDKDIALCHSHIPRQIAIWLGVPTTKHKALADLQVVPLSRWFKPFGAHEKLTRRLQNIIKEYPSNKDILKELIQNADDAEATEIHFIWDQRQHPEEKVLGNKWAALQGPSLCVYNNKKFTEKDIKGIQDLGEGGKAGNLEKTGKFGLGFNSVYHLTDCPSFVSGDSRLCVFDPNLFYLETASKNDPGGEFAITNNFKSSFPDVYNTYLPSFYDLEKGTMFRLPLRTEEMARSSEIKHETVTKEDITSLIQMLNEDPDGLMLFLNNIKKITFLILHRNAKEPQPVFTMEVKMSEESLNKRNEFLNKVQEAGHLQTEVMDLNPLQVFHEVEIHCTDKKPRKWILAKQVGVEEKEIKASMQDTCEKLNQKLLPHGAIAATLDTYSGGRLFCSLPLPVETGLPVHVNGNFAINCSRRDLWKEDGQNVRTEWNECLKLNLLAPLYGSLLLYIAEHLFQDKENPLRFKNEKDCENQLKAFLMLFPTDFENIHQQWHEVVVRIYQSIHARKHKVIPIVRSVGNESTDEPHFMTEEFRHKLVDILNDMNMKFVLQSTYLTAIYKGFERASSTVTALSPQSVRKFLINHPVLSQNKILSLPLSGSPFKDEKQISILLDYCITNIKEENERSLEGLPLLLTRDNILRRFQLEDPKYLSRFYDLFPNRSYLFVNVDYSCKVDPLEKAGFLKKFTIQESVDYIKEKLVHDVSEDDCNTWPVLRKEDNEWIKRLWEFFNYTYSVNSYTNESKKTEVFMELKHLFADLAILPVWNTKQDKQKVLSSLNRLQNVVCEDNMGELLMKLGFAKYDTSLPHDIMFHVIRPNVLNIKDPSTVLQKLIQTKGLQWDALSPLDYDRLLEFLLQGLKKTNDSQVCKQIQRLPIFEMMQGSRQAIDKFRCIYILNTKEEHPELYQIDSEIAFLKKSELNLEFAKNTDIQILNDFEFFNVVILQRIEQLSEPQKLSAIRLLLKIQHKYLIEYEKSKSKIINCLRPVKFIRDKHGNLREAAFFYDENNQLFKMMNLYEKFIPQAFFKNIMPAYSLQALLIDLGMRHTASQDDLINFATQIERDAQTRTSLKELKAKTNAILNIIFKFKEQDLSADFCKKLSNIKFIYPPEVPKWLCDLHVPYHHNQFMALNGSLVAQKDKDNELIWTTFPLLPFQNSSPILKSTGALFLPPQEKVIQNLRNVARVKCETTELIKSRAMVIETSYCFFQQSKSLDTKSLSQIPVILVDNDKRLVKPNKVVISLHNENDFRPYLYKMPPLLASYRELFQKIGVTIEATTEHYGRVLRDIFEDSKDSNNLQPNQIKTSKKAVENFFRTLKMDQDFQSLKVLYLPATDGKLYSSDRLCYNDYVITGNNRDFKSLEDKFKFMVSLRECHLKWDIYEIRKKIKLLPEEMRPKMLSETTVEGLEESKLELCRFGEKCEFRQKLIKLLTSPNFSDGVIAILKWQNRGDLPQSVSSHDLKELFSTIQITCCEKLEISIFYNSVSLENSSMQKEIYISKKHNVQFDIFMKHTNVLQGRKMVKIPKTLAQEINSLLEDILNKESVFVLFEMLCCTDPEDIYNVLSENGIPSFRSEKTNYFDLPSPGDVIPEEFLDFLEMDFLSSFEVGDFVGYLDSVSPELIYRYALVKECLGYEEEADGKVEWYKIEIGDNKVIKVSKNDIYQFKATKGVKNDCWDLVPLPHAENKSEINNEKCSKSLEEIKKEIDKCFEDIEKLPKAEREKAIRRLYLKWHPDKNLDNSEIATEVCKYIQQLKEGKKPSPSNCGSSQDGQYHRSKNEWYDWFNWDKEASRHRKGKTNFNFRYPSYDYDSFRFRSRQQPNPAEAKRWMKQAEHDLSSASSDIGQSNTEWVFFKVHQAVEKALIATHYKYDGKYPKGQCILGLSQNVSMFAGSLSELSDLVHKLCQYGVDNKRTQYPIYHAIPNIPNGQFPAEKEQEVLELGKSVLYKIQNYISL
ncbi:SACS protein, partial [Amia calva]|nr:SACS protein [Amia calva]